MMVSAFERSWTAQAVIKGPDGNSSTDPTLAARHMRRSSANLIQNNFGREVMESRSGGPNTLLQALPAKVDLLA